MGEIRARAARSGGLSFAAASAGSEHTPAARSVVVVTGATSFDTVWGERVRIVAPTTPRYRDGVRRSDRFGGWYLRASFRVAVVMVVGLLLLFVVFAIIE